MAISAAKKARLLEAIEGKRSEPRNKPPFPGTNGLWDQPTVINNVETFSLATVILARGLDWYKTQGKNGSVGMKFVGISGDVVRPGIFEVPMGTTYSDLIFQYAGGIPDGKQMLALRAVGPIIGIPARIDGQSSSRLERGGRGRLNGGFGSNRRLRRGSLHARYGVERNSLLPERVLR